MVVVQIIFQLSMIYQDFICLRIIYCIYWISFALVVGLLDVWEGQYDNWDFTTRTRYENIPGNYWPYRLLHLILRYKCLVSLIHWAYFVFVRFFVVALISRTNDFHLRGVNFEHLQYLALSIIGCHPRKDD